MIKTFFDKNILVDEYLICVNCKRVINKAINNTCTHFSTFFNFVLFYLVLFILDKCFNFSGVIALMVHLIRFHLYIAEDFSGVPYKDQIGLMDLLTPCGSHHTACKYVSTLEDTSSIQLTMSKPWQLWLAGVLADYIWEKKKASEST